MVLIVSGTYSLGAPLMEIEMNSFLKVTTGCAFFPQNFDIYRETLVVQEYLAEAMLTYIYDRHFRIAELRALSLITLTNMDKTKCSSHIISEHTVH